MKSFKSFIKESHDYDADIEEAHEKLDHHWHGHHTNDKNGPDSEQMLNIVPYPSHYPKIDQSHFDDPKKLKLKNVPVSSLRSTQHEVSYDVVGKKLRGEITEHFPEHPVVLHHQGIHYVYDGNHRACVHILKGDSHMKAYVLEAPKGTELGETRMRKKAHPDAIKYQEH